MNNLINFTLDNETIFKLRTKFKIPNEINKSSWKKIDNQITKKYKMMVKKDKILDYDYNLTITNNYIFDYIDIEVYNIVILIKDEVSLFTLPSYLSYIKDSNIKVYIYPDEKYKDISLLFFSDIYHQDIKEKNLSFTDMFIKNIPIKKININTVYYYNINYKIDRFYNCFKFNENHNKVEKIKIEEYNMQKFHDSSIIWFLDKLYDKKLHLYSHKNIVVCFKNFINENIDCSFCI